MQQVVYVPIDQLTPHPENPRTINQDQFKVLCESIKRNPDYFETRPILINKQMVIFAGNMRYLAAKEIGLTEVPCSMMDISEERQKELMMRDNRQNGEWNWDILANFDKGFLLDVGFAKDEISKGFNLGFVKEEEKDNSVPALKPLPIAKNGDLWQLGRHKLYCGDSTKKDRGARLKTTPALTGLKHTRYFQATLPIFGMQASLALKLLKV